MRKQLIGRLIAVVTALYAVLVSGADDRNLAITRIDIPPNEQRIALVIGNAGYAASPLKNPINDAQDVSAKLKTLGFQVVERRNLTTRQIGGTLREFRSRLQPGAVALVFYAGHGFQIRGENYLPAVDAEISSEEDVPNQSLAVRQIMDVLEEAKTRVNLVFLDACRNNPYARSFRSAADGLARMNAPSGTLISFATRPGSVAADGSGRNGLYTEQLLKQMTEPNVPIEQVLKRVLSGVKTASAGRQEPWMEGSLEGEFYFRVGAQLANLMPVPATPGGGGVALDDIRQQQEAKVMWDKWQAAMQADFDKVAGLNAAPDLMITAWERFLARYAQKNPFGDNDERLRGEARNRKLGAEAEKQRRAVAAATQRPGEVFRDCADCPEMVVIPTGSFDMGSPAQEQGRNSDEGPVHAVTIGHAFALAKTEVTVAQFRAFVQATGYRTDAEKNVGINGCNALDVGAGKFDWRPGRYWDAIGFEQTNHHPAACLSRNDAKEYVKWLTARTGKTYRLPSEAEWEWAARTGNKDARPWGDEPDGACRNANVADQSMGPGGQPNGLAGKHGCVDGYFYTAPVASYAPNAFGVHDMIGNVWEWTDDCYHESYSGAPANGSAWVAGNCERYVLRGGSWANGPRATRSASRNGSGTAYRADNSGFRPARTLP